MTDHRTPDQRLDGLLDRARERIPGFLFWPLLCVGVVITALVFYGWVLLRLLFMPPQSFRDWWDSI